MSLSARCKAECDGCGKEVIREVVLNDQTAKGIMEASEEKWEDDFLASAHTYASDIWSWCYPEGWLQVAEDKVTGQKYLFFCGGDCYKDWLRRQDRLGDVARFDNAVWVA